VSSVSARAAAVDEFVVNAPARSLAPTGAAIPVAAH
jgi:hypothetical protein